MNWYLFTFYLLMWLQLVIMAIVPLFFCKELADKFDNRFKKHLPLTDFFNPFFPHYARASVYATWIAWKNIFGRHRPDVQAYDFRSQISDRTYRLCVFHTINVVIFCLTWVPMGFYLMIRDWLR